MCFQKPDKIRNAKAAKYYNIQERGPCRMKEINVHVHCVNLKYARGAAALSNSTVFDILNFQLCIEKNFWPHYGES